MKTRVYVTKSDILEGAYGGSCHCPVARALGRAFPETYVAVGTKTLTVGYTKLPLPEIVATWIERFDCTSVERTPATSKPFRFTVEI